MTTDKKTKSTDTPKEDSLANQPPPGKEKNKADKKAMAGEKTIDALEKLLCEEKDRVLRLSAEFENYKKRKQRELDDFKKFANETIFKQLLTVVDNLERALSSAEEVSEDQGLTEGIKLTHKEILKMFELFGVKPVDALNQSFDPNFHQAVTQVETDDHPENTVTSELQKGYLLHDRLIRPAMVVVSKKNQTNTETNKEN